MIDVMPEQPRERLHASLNLRMPLTTMQRLEGHASQLGVSVSDVARLAISHGLTAAHDEIAAAIEHADAPDA